MQERRRDIDLAEFRGDGLVGRGVAARRLDQKLVERLKQLGWSKWWIICVAAVLRGSYHLYQGFGSFVGNFIMGIIFGWLYTRFGRVLPLVIAHFIIDGAVFVGYPWAASTFPHLF